MIKTFKDKDSELLFKAQSLKEVPQQFRHIVKQAWRKLDILNALPSLKVGIELLGKKNFKPLKGNMKDNYSVRINDQYRVCFEWGNDNNIYELEVNKHYWD